MKDLFKKNKKVVLLCTGIVFIAVLAIIISSVTKENEFADANLDPESITKIRIKLSEIGLEYSASEIYIQQPENITKIINYIKSMSNVNVQTSINGVYPLDYEFTYFLKNGKVKTYTHSYLSVVSDDGFDSIFRLKEVIPQIHHVFTTKLEDIKEVKMYLWVSADAEEPIEYFFKDQQEIEAIIKFGQENMLEDINKAKANTPMGVEFFAKPGDITPIFNVPISPDMYKYEELCEKVPKVKEFAEKLG